MVVVANPGRLLPARGGAVGRLSFVPDTDRVLWPATPGAICTVIAWAIALIRLSFYLTTFPDRGLTYVSLGTTAVDLLFYMYPLAAVMPIGLKPCSRSPHELRDRL